MARAFFCRSTFVARCSTAAADWLCLEGLRPVFEKNGALRWESDRPGVFRTCPLEPTCPPLPVMCPPLPPCPPPVMCPPLPPCPPPAMCPPLPPCPPPVMCPPPPPCPPPPWPFAKAETAEKQLIPTATVRAIQFRKAASERNHSNGNKVFIKTFHVWPRESHRDRGSLALHSETVSKKGASFQYKESKNRLEKG